MRDEPVDSVQRIAEDNIGSQNASGLDPAPSTTLFPGTDAATVNLSAEPYHLSDVVMYVQTDAGLETVDPFTGAVETALSSTGSNVGDIAMVPGTNSDGTTGTYAGTLYSISRGATSNYVDQSQAAGIVSAIDTGTGSAVSSVWDGLITYRYSTIPNSAPALEEEGDNTATTVAPEPGGVSMEAMANSGSSWFVIGNADRLYTDGGTDNPSNPQGKDDPNLPAEVTNSDNLLYMLNSSGTAIDAPGQVVTDDATTPRLTTNIIPLASLTTDDHVGSDGKPDHNPAFIGSITGLSFVGGNLYAVTNTGNLYQILNYSSPGFTPTPNPDNTTDYETIKSISGGPSLHYIGTVKTDGTNPTNVDFAGLTTGPKDVDNAAYANMLFGISRTGDLYALGLTTTTNPTTGVTTTTVAKQGIFLDSKTHITIPNLTTVSGLAFSTLDANMWHVTDNSDPGHSTNVTYDESRTVQLPTDPTTNECFYFGQNESLSTATPGNYNAPGGDYGSLITQPFSLANYSASDVPTLYFDYAARQRGFAHWTAEQLRYRPRVRFRRRRHLALARRHLGQSERRFGQHRGQQRNSRSGSNSVWFRRSSRTRLRPRPSARPHMVACRFRGRRQHSAAVRLQHRRRHARRQFRNFGNGRQFGHDRRLSRRPFRRVAQ